MAEPGRRAASEDDIEEEQLEKGTYHHVYQSHGGVYEMPYQEKSEWPKINEQTHYCTAIGSTGCRTCVCVFVELSDTSCFAAHISADDYDARMAAEKKKDQSLAQEIADNRAMYVPDPGKAAKLMSLVLKKLRETPGLSKQVKDGTFAGDVKRAVVLCPHKVWGGEYATGTYIIEALQKFFKVEMKCHKGHGFIASSSTGRWNVQIVGWKYGYPGPSDSDTEYYQWKIHDERSEDHGWTRANRLKNGTHPAGGWSFQFTKANSWTPYPRMKVEE